MSSPTTGPTEPMSAHVGHETTDVNIRAILWLALAVAVGTICVAVMLIGVLRYYGAAAARRDPELSPLAERREPPAPRLQKAPIAAYEEFRDREEQQLNSYGWVDREQGIVRIPIERAIEMALQRGLPSPSGPAAPHEDEPQPPTGETPAPNPGRE